VRLLLDTHVLLWALVEPRRLSAAAARVIRDPTTDVLVSSASAWEIATKFRLGSLRGAEPIVAGYQAHLDTLRARELPMSAAHALKAGGFPVEHRDPFDRMLAAQGILEGLPVVTSDPVFALFRELETLW